MPSVLLMARLKAGAGVSVSVALLLAVLESVTPMGGVTVTVLTRLPVAEHEICAATVLAGETSLACAVLHGDWVSSHEQLGRNRP